MLVNPPSVTTTTDDVRELVGVMVALVSEVALEEDDEDDEEEDDEEEDDEDDEDEEEEDEGTRRGQKRAKVRVTLLPVGTLS